MILIACAVFMSLPLSNTCFADTTNDEGDTVGYNITDETTGDYYSDDDNNDYTDDTTDAAETGDGDYYADNSDETSSQSASADTAGAGRTGVDSGSNGSTTTVASEPTEKTFTDNAKQTGQSKTSTNVVGVVMWIFVLISVLLIIVYAIFAGIRDKKERRRAKKKPKLVFSSGYVKDPKNFDDYDEL